METSFQQYTFRDATTKCCALTVETELKEKARKMYKHLCKPSLATGKPHLSFHDKVDCHFFHGCVSHCKVWRHEMKFLSRSRGDRAREMRDIRILEDFIQEPMYSLDFRAVSIYVKQR